MEKANWEGIEKLFCGCIADAGVSYIASTMAHWKKQRDDVDRKEIDNRYFLRIAYIMSLARWKYRMNGGINRLSGFLACGLCFYQGQGVYFESNKCMGCRLHRRGNAVWPCCEEYYLGNSQPENMYNRILKEYKIEFAKEIEEENSKKVSPKI